MLSIFTVLVLLVSNLDTSLTKDNIEDFIHIGCFKKNSTETLPNGHAGAQGFWCIENCHSDYAGVNVDECFCGEEIANIFEAVDSTDCEVCFTHPSRYCGGSNALSLYKMLFSKASETTILLATNNDLRMWGFEHVTDVSFGAQLSENSGISSVAYDAVDQTIYYVSGGTIFRILYFKYIRIYDGSSQVAVKTKCSHVVDFDWVNSEVFWGCQNTKSIHWKNGFSHGNHHIYSGDTQTFVVEPYRKFLLYVNSTEFAKYDFIAHKTNILKIQTFKRVEHIALDVQQERFYFISSYEEEGEKLLVSTDYNLTTFKIAFRGVELSDPFELDAVNGTVCWGNKNDDNYTVYKSQMACSNTHDSCELVNVTMLFTQTEKINDFKIYTHEAGRPSTNYLCERKRCSHMCIRLSANEVGCRCPDTLAKDEDGTTCVRQLPTTVIPTSSKTLILEAESDHVSTVVGDSSITEKNPLKCTMKLSEENDSSKDQKDYVTSEMNDNTPQPTESTLEVMLKKNGSFQKSVYSLITVSLITLVTLVLFLIYLAVRLRRRKRSCERQRQHSELVELPRSDW